MLLVLNYSIEFDIECLKVGRICLSTRSIHEWLPQKEKRAHLFLLKKTTMLEQRSGKVAVVVVVVVLVSIPRYCI